MHLSLNDLFHWWSKVTDPGTWQRAGNEFSGISNNINNFRNRLPQPGSSPIQAPQSLGDVWNSLKERLK